MSLLNKTFWDIYKNPGNILPKVNFRQYITNLGEPSETVSGLSTATLNSQSGIIEETYLHKQVIRKLANQLRMEE